MVIGYLRCSGAAVVGSAMAGDVEGSLAGQCLKQIEAHKDYWFDWMNHHPGSAVFKS